MALSSPVSPRDLGLKEKKFQSIEEIEAAYNILVRRMNDVYKYNRRDHDRLTEDVEDVTEGGTLTVEAHTTNDTLTEAESGSVHSNKGATGTITFTLPVAPSAGVNYWFTVAEGYVFYVQPGAADKIIGGTDGAKMSSYTSVAANARIVADSDGDWHVISMFGTWIIE